MPSVRIPNIAVSYTLLRPSCAKKGFQAYTEVYFPSYVHFGLYLVQLFAHFFPTDDATGRQFGSSLHDLYHPQAVCFVHLPTWSTTSRWDYVCNRCGRRPRDGMCHAAIRVCPFFSCSDLFDVWYSVIKTRMQSLNARQEYKNSFHCGYRILTEEGLFRFWTGTAPRLVRLVVSNRLGSPCMQRITVTDEWRDHLYCIRKRHQSYWRTGVEVVSLDGYIVCTSNPAISAHAFPFRRLYWKSCSLDHID